MIDNKRGGIISKLFIIPAGVALMLGFFFLGYYIGRYESKTASPDENMQPLPDVVSKNLPKPEEFTFYKTLTEKEDRTVSIDLKSKSANTASESEKKQSFDVLKTEDQKAAKEGGTTTIPEKKATLVTAEKKTVVQASPVAEKQAATRMRGASAKLRFTIQVSSHLDRRTAEDDVRRMKQNGFAAFIITSELQGKGTWYRVRIGSFASRVAAERLQKDIHAKVGLEPIVVLE
ncbi:MAG TPA: SPOR domain-containing protein [Nitrospirota bacterium]|nr:SPOR domain-containing protein [Nitrospirota bacterium]